MPYRALMGLIPTLQATALVNENLRVVKKKKVGTHDLVGLGVTNIVGTSLIRVNAGLIAGL